MNFAEKFLKNVTHVKGHAVGFRIDQVLLPNKKKGYRDYLDHPGAVGVLPFLSHDKILLVQQYRFPVRQLTWEIPAGKLDKGENPLLCVKRELAEETGYTAGRVQKLLSFWPTAAFANEVIHLYTASRLKRGKTNPDEDEFVRCRIWTLKEALRAIQKGKIKDSKTIIALLMGSSPDIGHF